MCLCEFLRENETLSESFQHSFEHWELVEVKVVTGVALLCQITLNERESEFCFGFFFVFYKARGEDGQKETTKLNLPESFATVSLCILFLFH